MVRWKNRLADPEEFDPTIKLDDANEFFNKYDEQKKQAHRASSFVAHGIKYA